MRSVVLCLVLLASTVLFICPAVGRPIPLMPVSANASGDCSGEDLPAGDGEEQPAPSKCAAVCAGLVLFYADEETCHITSTPAENVAVDPFAMNGRQDRPPTPPPRRS